MKSDIKVYKEIQNLISLKKFDESIKFIELNKKKLSELDYWLTAMGNISDTSSYLKVCYKKKPLLIKGF